MLEVVTKAVVVHGTAVQSPRRHSLQPRSDRREPDAVLKATAVIAPIANILLNLFSFMFVLCFVKRMLPVVTNFDCFRTGLIQPQRRFVDSEVSGRIFTRYAAMISLRF